MINDLVSQICQFGGKPYYVGGYVRDLLMGLPTKDIDIVITNITQSDLEKALFPFKPKYCGAVFGVYKIENYDIALPRLEVSRGIGHTDFHISIHKDISLNDDLGRRDFSINAMAMDILTEEIIDPYQGQKDLKNKIIRQLNTKSIEEDYLRGLRAIQFSSRLNFIIEEKTVENILKYRYLLPSISAERVQLELNKLLLSNNLSLGFSYLEKTHLMEDLYPHLHSLYTSNQSYYRKLLDTISHSEKDIELRLSLLFNPLHMTTNHHQHNICSTESLHIIENKLKDFKYSNKIISSVLTLISDPILDGTNFVIKKTLGHYGLTMTKRMLLFYYYTSVLSCYNELNYTLSSLYSELERVINSNEPNTLSDLAVNGSDLICLGLSGKDIGITLNYLLDCVLESPELNTKETLFKLAKTHTRN